MSAQFGISHEEEVMIDVGAARLAGTLAIPGEQKKIVVFAHGSSSGRHSRRNQYEQECGETCLAKKAAGTR